MIVIFALFDASKSSIIILPAADRAQIHDSRVVLHHTYILETLVLQSLM